MPIAAAPARPDAVGFLAFVLDAVAIAAQAITGRHLGAGDVVSRPRGHPTDGRLGRVGGAVTGVAPAAASPVPRWLFTPDHRGSRPARPRASRRGPRPAGGRLVFVLDGVLIGAGDGATWPGPGWWCWPGTPRPCCCSPAPSTAWWWCGRCSGGVHRRALRHPRRRERGDAWLVTGALRLPCGAPPGGRPRFVFLVLVTHRASRLLDLYADPVGWVLVLIGLHGLRGSIERTATAPCSECSAQRHSPSRSHSSSPPPLDGWPPTPRSDGGPTCPASRFFAVLCYLLSAAALRHKSTIGAAGFNLSRARAPLRPRRSAGRVRRGRDRRRNGRRDRGRGGADRAGHPVCLPSPGGSGRARGWRRSRPPRPSPTAAATSWL